MEKMIHTGLHGSYALHVLRTLVNYGVYWHMMLNRASNRRAFDVECRDLPSGEICIRRRAPFVDYAGTVWVMADCTKMKRWFAAQFKLIINEMCVAGTWDANNIRSIHECLKPTLKSKLAFLDSPIAKSPSIQDVHFVYDFFCKNSSSLKRYDASVMSRLVSSKRPQELADAMIARTNAIDAVKAKYCSLHAETTSAANAKLMAAIRQLRSDFNMKTDARKNEVIAQIRECGLNPEEFFDALESGDYVFKPVQAGRNVVHTGLYTPIAAFVLTWLISRLQAKAYAIYKNVQGARCDVAADGEVLLLSSPYAGSRKSTIWSNSSLGAIKNWFGCHLEHEAKILLVKDGRSVCTWTRDSGVEVELRLKKTVRKLQVRALRCICDALKSRKRLKRWYSQAIVSETVGIPLDPITAEANSIKYAYVRQIVDDFCTWRCRERQKLEVDIRQCGLKIHDEQTLARSKLMGLERDELAQVAEKFKLLSQNPLEEKSEAGCQIK